ncbi:MAG: hypothetical protein LC104_05180 [Bacteroidales bacterium]|nr:hypothetical protein [Bacteroidales bacterium]
MLHIVRIAAAVTTVGVGLQSIGCMHSEKHPHQGPIEAHYDNLVDRCWPTNYSNMAQHNVLAPFAIQATNAHILDQTVWPWMFEPGTARLNPAGISKLDYLVQRRPAPDGRVFLQTASDTIYNPAEPAKYVAEREKLDAQRGQAVLDYFAARTAGRPLHFEIQVIDAPDPAIPSVLASNASRGLVRMYRSTILGMGGAGGMGGGGGGMGGGGGGMGGGGGGGMGGGNNSLTGAGGQGANTAPLSGPTGSTPAP